MPWFRHLSSNRRGAVIAEFALVFPMLAMLLLGMLGYGQYFLLAHSAQQLANDSARATVAGLSMAERVTLAEAAVARDLGALPEVPANTVTVAVEESADIVRVRVRINASRIALFRVPLIPMPDALIERRAVVRRGGMA